MGQQQKDIGGFFLVLICAFCFTAGVWSGLIEGRIQGFNASVDFHKNQEKCYKRLPNDR